MVSVQSAVAILWGIIPWVSFWLFTFSGKHLFISFAHFSGGFLFWFGFLFLFVCLKVVIEQFASHSIVFCSPNPGLKWEDDSIWDGLGVKKLDLVWGGCKRKTGTLFLFLLLKPLFTFVSNTPASGILFSQRGPVPFIFPFLSVWQPWRQSGGVSIPHWHCLRNSNPLPPSLPYFSFTPVEPLPLWPWDYGLLHTL